MQNFMPRYIPSTALPLPLLYLILCPNAFLLYSLQECIGNILCIKNVLPPLLLIHDILDIRKSFMDNLKVSIPLRILETVCLQVG